MQRYPSHGKRTLTKLLTQYVLSLNIKFLPPVSVRSLQGVKEEVTQPVWM